MTHTFDGVICQKISHFYYGLSLYYCYYCTDLSNNRLKNPFCALLKSKRIFILSNLLRMGLHVWKQHLTFGCIPVHKEDNGWGGESISGIIIILSGLKWGRREGRKNPHFVHLQRWPAKTKLVTFWLTIIIKIIKMPFQKGIL